MPHTSVAVVTIILIVVSEGRLLPEILISETVDQNSTQAYDCVHYTNEHGHIQSLPYCRRTESSITLNRSNKGEHCQNDGSWIEFTSLRDNNFTAEELLGWSSGVDVADAYGAFLDGDSVDIDGLCNCSKAGTFGRRCEYELQNNLTFADELAYQFSLKLDHRIGSQLYGDQLCYSSLTTCDSGATCLDWRQICDGKQQCLDGRDEDHCEQLFYSICENPQEEYRCQNGFCIDADFVLDGELDCNDQADEQRNYNNYPHYDCWYLLNFDCDERLFITKEHFSCGTGDVVFEEWTMKRHVRLNSPCFSFRDKQFMCELDAYEPMWTASSNGHCLAYVDPSNQEEPDTCQFLIKCALTDKLNAACPCSGNGCRTPMTQANCLDPFPYPAKPVFVPFVRTYYQISTHDFVKDKWPDLYRFVGSVKCRGYQAFVDKNDPVWATITLKELNIYLDWMYWRPFEYIFCENALNLSSIRRNYSAENNMYPADCWNSTYSGRSAICPVTNTCVPVFHIRDGYPDCADYRDEAYTLTQFNESKAFLLKANCSDVANFRFRCSVAEETCFTVDIIGNTYSECILSGNRDEVALESKILFINIDCLTKGSAECRLLLDYIQNVTLSHAIQLLKGDHMYGDSIAFWQYCDTRWDLEYGMDERSDLCGGGEWVCPVDYYQCNRSRQCIPKIWLCNGVWDCNDGTDEEGFQMLTELSEHNVAVVTNLTAMKIQCSEANSARAFQRYCNQSIEYPCLLAQPYGDPLDFLLNRPCINLTQIGDGVSDCYGSLDERNILSCSAQKEVGFEFQCHSNVSNEQCLFNAFLCDTARCSNGHDELLCKAQLSPVDKTRRRCDGSIAAANDQHLDIHCYNGTCIAGAECNEKCQCADCEDEYYCITGRYFGTYRSYVTYYRYLVKPHLNVYPTGDTSNTTEEGTQENSTMTTIFSDSRQQAQVHSYQGWVCNRGLFLRQSNTTEIICLCPPSFFGARCQYMSDRITVIVYFEDRTHSLKHPIKILTRLLLTENETVVAHHQFHYTPVLNDLERKHRFYLVYPRPRHLSGGQSIYQIRFQAYHLFPNGTLGFFAVWQYPVRFDFLPVQRLAKVLRYGMPRPIRNNTHLCSSSTDNPCLNGSRCYPLMNTNDSNSFWCECNHLTWGKRCEHSSNSCLSAGCAPGSICQPKQGHDGEAICLCPINRHGPTCHLRRQCDPLKGHNPCFPNGQCHVRFDPENLLKDYICTCRFGFFGSLCEYHSSTIHLHYNQSIHKHFAVAILQLCDYDEKLNLLVRHQTLYTNTWPQIDNIIYDKQFNPQMAFVKIFQSVGYAKETKNQIGLRGSLYLVYVHSDQRKMNVSLTFDKVNQCPSIYELLNRTESSMNSNHSLVYKYHSVCQHNASRLCFHDINSICLCDVNRRAECFRYDRKVESCQHCLSNGYCFQGSLTDRTNFLCLCPRCYFGSICQYNTEMFSFSLESLLSNDIFSLHVPTRVAAIVSYVLVVLFLFCIGLVNNLLSGLTFRRTKPRTTGTGYYLLFNSFFAQFSLLCLSIKITLIIVNTSSLIDSFVFNQILCKISTFSLSTSTRMTYWLTALVTLERSCVAIYPMKIWFKRPRTAKCLTVTTLILVISSHCHELVYYDVVQDPKNSHRGTWCVARFSQLLFQIDRANVLFHHIAPFAFHLICSLLLVVTVARKRATATGGVAMALFRKHLVEQRELFIPACFIILSALPQFIISFSLACTDFNRAWQRYSLTIAYFLSFAPQTLTFMLYVQSSTLFKEQFHATAIGRMWLSRVTKNNPTVQQMMELTSTVSGRPLSDASPT